MEPIILTGYQYGSYNQYIGLYNFHKNLNQEKVYLPPNTVMIAPPVIPNGQQAVWNGTQWNLQTMKSQSK